eukprot:7194513-Prymnesium_polylepis.1
MPPLPPFTPLSDEPLVYEVYNVTSCTQATTDGTIYPRGNQPFTVEVHFTSAESALAVFQTAVIFFWGSYNADPTIASMFRLEYKMFNPLYISIIGNFFSSDTNTIGGIQQSDGGLSDAQYGYFPLVPMRLAIAFDGQNLTMRAGSSVMTKSYPAGSAGMTTAHATDTLHVGCRPGGQGEFLWGSIARFRLWRSFLDVRRFDLA